MSNTRAFRFSDFRSMLAAVSHGIDSYQAAFFLGAVLFIAFTAWHGWRLGILRQLINILALAAAYIIIGYCGGSHLGPFLHHFIDLHPNRPWPDGGAVGLGFVVYCCITLIGVIAFTKTSQQRAGLFRLGYGISGSICGAFYGLFLVWITVLAIRLLGSVAESQIAVASLPPITHGRTSASPTPPPIPPSGLVRTLAHMKQSLEQGPAGAVVQQVDPIPGTLYGILHKLGMMVSDDKSVDRFLSYPGVKPLLAHPKIAALQNDPDITRDLVDHNYFALIRNPRIITAANDAEIAELMRKFEFEKALDYALQPAASRRPRPDRAGTCVVQAAPGKPERHPTSNTRHPTSNRLGCARVMEKITAPRRLDVECWILDVGCFQTCSSPPSASKSTCSSRRGAKCSAPAQSHTALRPTAIPAPSASAFPARSR